ncbi:MAG TPA: efflux RND transporter periplasmic adaptor subunit [Acidobacteriaceae bacterium]|jgi:multidrug efflux system membrane fusion protein|nr:efflux RND transporter periplasmic adaptor subunit [Acidobacteriaceae bacterium]
MALEDSRDKRPHAEDLGQSFEAHSGNVGSAFEERNASPELLVHKKSHAVVWVIVVVAALLAVFLVYYFTKPKTGGATAGQGRGQNGPAAITVGKTAAGNINVYVSALGTVTPVSTVTLFSQITGVVMSVHYREGQIVRKGDALVDIDPRPYEATLTQAEGVLEHDQGVLAQAEMDLKRYQAAYARNAIAKQQLDDQEKLVMQLQGTVKADQGTVDYDTVQLGYCHIVSPINGRVGLRLVDPGNTVFSGSSSTLVVITQLQPITMVFNVSEDDLPGVQTELKGNKAMEVDAFDRSDETMLEAGKLTSLDNQIDTTTGTVKFRASFPNKNFVLFPNQFVNARLLERTLDNATLAPTAAVQYNGTAAFVYIVDTTKNTVAVQPVQVVTGNDKVTAVTGVNTGVTVATSGFDRLENGAHVQVHQNRQKSTTPSTGMGPNSGGSRTP